MTPSHKRDGLGDRRIHAINSNGRAELARYDRAGKWYIEDADLGRSHVTLAQAVRVAHHWMTNGGVVRFNVPGGSAFERQVRRIESRKGTKHADD